MKPCKKHWNKLRTAIDARGIGHLVSSSGENAIEKFKEYEDTGAETLDNYDPLIAALMGTLAQLLRRPGGLGILSPNPDGTERCMWCYVNEECPCPGKDCGERWIEYAADGVKDTVDRMRDEEFPLDVD
jgi:hypothetical protein